MNSKLLVGISQRVIDLKNRNERRDTLDQSWTMFLEKCGFEIVIIPNCHSDPVSYLKRLGVSALILSGGGDISNELNTHNGKKIKLKINSFEIAPERDRTEQKLLEGSLILGWPVIGVCRGMEIINLFHGGQLEKVSGHSKTQHSISVPLDKTIPDFFDKIVNSYHDLGIPINRLGDGLIELAKSDNYVEAFIHKKYLHCGIMWHPERNSPWSTKDINFFKKFLRIKSINELLNYELN